MTREERQKAIDALKISAPVIAVTQEEFNDYIQTLNQVMDWLEQELCEDAISRRELNNKIEMLDMRYGSDFYWETKGIIDKLPSVYPKQKTGHWIDKDVRGSIEPYCSVCGDSVDTTYHYNYCPNCGAIIVESEGEG